MKAIYHAVYLEEWVRVQTVSGRMQCGSRWKRLN